VNTNLGQFVAVALCTAVSVGASTCVGDSIVPPNFALVASKILSGEARGYGAKNVTARSYSAKIITY
jgi:hypothetical protein